MVEPTVRSLGEPAPGTCVDCASRERVFEFEPLEAATEKEFHREFNINVLGPILTIQEALKYLGPGGASVIEISSVASSIPVGNAAVHAATQERPGLDHPRPRPGVGAAEGPREPHRV